MQLRYGYETAARPNGAGLFMLCALLVAGGAAGSGSARPAETTSSAPARAVPEPDAPVACVASAHPLASKAGIEALRQGGNAVDAAVATAFALAVVEPHASGPGGGGFLLYFDPATSKTHFVDYREVAPRSLKPEHSRQDGRLSTATMSRGGMSVGAPGMVRGLLQAHSRFGKLPLAQLLEPAVHLAEKGFPVSSQLAVQMGNETDRLLQFEAGARVFLEDEMFPREEGTTLTLPALGATIRNIVARGDKAIYDDAPARAICEAVRAAGGILEPDDILRFQPRWREPLTGKYRGYTIVTSAPPGSGGIQILQILAILESFPVGKMDRRSPEYIALLLSAIATAQVSAESNVADPAFHTAPIGELLSPEWAAAAAAKISFVAPDKRSAPAREDVGTTRPAPGNTTHLSVMDTMGGAVALTQTINGFFGSGVVSEKLGVVLNNELYDFDFEEGSVNVPEAGKIPRSNMSPTLIFRDGRLVASVGTPGGRRIGASLAQILVNKIDFGLPLQEAIDAPRVFVETNLGRVSYETRISSATMEAAVKLLDGETFRKIRGMPEFSVFFGGAQGCWLEETTGGLRMAGAADPRRDGFVEYLRP